MVVVPNDLNYKYLYTFSLNRVETNHQIDYYTIEHLSSNGTEVAIRVTPPNNKKALQINPYEGTLKFQQNRMVLSYSNSEDYVCAIFNPHLANRQTKYLVGVIIGIADFNEKIPIAKKTILTKEPVEDVEALYLTLNETERILANENSFKFKDDNDNKLPSHLESYINKIAMLNSLFDNLLTKGYFPSFYEQLAFKEFRATDKLFDKFQKHHSFFTHYRKRVLDILMDSYKTNPYENLFMVMPIYNEENLFEEQSNKAIELQKGLKELSSHVEIEIIFVIDRCNIELKEEFISFLKEVSSLMKIGFALKENIEDEVDSIDFIFTNLNDFVVAKSLRTNTTLFQLYRHENSIDDYHTFFRKISIRSNSYESFMQKREKICAKTNPLLKNLSGKWHFYIHGSKQYWDDEIYIFEDGRVEYYSEGKRTEIGTIVTKEYESVMLLDDPITKRGVIVVFDNQHYKIQKAFFAKVIAKQMESDLDMFSIGLFSRKAIAKDKAMEILGDVDGVRLLESVEMYRRLTNYLVENV